MSPEGDKVSFYSTRDLNLYVINSDGTNLTNVTKGALTQQAGAGYYDVNHTFSPDGGRIILASYADINTNNSDLFMVNSDGTDLTNVTETKAAAEQNPAFSPDGNQLVFVRYPVTPRPLPRSEVYVMDTDGTNQKRLTNDEAIEVLPTFSPDGKKIAFERGDLDTPPNEVYAIDIDGSDQHELVEGVPEMYGFDFSPDGEKVAFTAYDRTALEQSGAVHFGPQAFDIYVVNVDGTNLTRLTYKWGFDGEPAFVPGTDMVAFASDRDGDSDIYAIRLDGTGLTNLTDTDSADELAPTFSADGTKMAYQSLRPMSSIYEIYMMNVTENTDTNYTAPDTTKEPSEGDSARQEGKRVTFSPGSHSATLKGSVIRGERDEYLLDARARQQMSVRISSLEDNAVFHIVEPGSNRTLPGAGERDDAREWSGELPTSGDYTIVVGGTRGNATYTLRVTIT
jgi:Tol biopolymer transport system component